MTLGIKSHGITIGIGDEASPESYILLGEMLEMPPIGGTKGLIAFTNQDSVDFEEYLPKALADGNELKIQANFIPGNTGAAAFDAAYADQLSHNFQVTYRNNSTRTFPAICLAWEESASELDGRMLAGFTLKIVGAIIKSDPA